MNRENIQKVRDHIAAIPASRFNMGSYFDGPTTEARTYRGMAEGACGSCACIAGHALALLVPNGRSGDYVMRARRLLGLNNREALRLFEPESQDYWFMGEELRHESVTRDEAVRVLDHLLETGKVDWSIIGAVTP